VALSVIVTGPAHSAVSTVDPKGLWQDVAEADIAARGERWVQPARYRALKLNYAALQAHFAACTNGKHGARASSLKLSLPLPDGVFAEFAIVESPIMEAALAAKYPSIRTSAGQGVSDPTASLRPDLTPLGFNAPVLSAQGDYYIDLYQATDNEHYVSYLRRDAGENTD
jgi:hypothetical protein